MRPYLLPAACALAATLSYAAPQATPGQWEMSSQMTMNGMNVKIPATTTKFCIKPEDAKNLQKQAMGGPHGPANKDCKMLENSVNGDTVSFHMRCEGKQAMEIKGDVTYGSTSYKGNTVVDMNGGPQGKMHMTNQFSAKRIGDCP